MGAVTRAELDIRRRECEYKNKCPFQGQSSHNGPKFKKSKSGQWTSQETGFNTELPRSQTLSKCNLRHLRKCRKAVGVCLGCDQTVEQDQVKVQTPVSQRKQNQMLGVFTMTHEEAEDATGVVSGIILIQNVSAYVLFDCGATNSFMSKRFAKKIRHKSEILE